MERFVMNYYFSLALAFIAGGLSMGPLMLGIDGLPGLFASILILGLSVGHVGLVQGRQSARAQSVPATLPNWEEHYNHAVRQCDELFAIVATNQETIGKLEGVIDTYKNILEMRDAE